MESQLTFADDVVFVDSQEAARELDAADGRFDGLHFGKRIVVRRDISPDDVVFVPSQEAASELDAADGKIDGLYFGKRIVIKRPSPGGEQLPNRAPGRPARRRAPRFPRPPRHGPCTCPFCETWRERLRELEEEEHYHGPPAEIPPPLGPPASLPLSPPATPPRPAPPRREDVGPRSKGEPLPRHPSEAPAHFQGHFGPIMAGTAHRYYGPNVVPAFPGRAPY
eukprot:EG_transcript_24280